MKRELKLIAKKIWQYEKECQQGNNISENMLKITELTSELSIDDILEIDAYMEKKFLTK